MFAAAAHSRRRGWMEDEAYVVVEVVLVFAAAIQWMHLVIGSCKIVIVVEDLLLVGWVDIIILFGLFLFFPKDFLIVVHKNNIVGRLQCPINRKIVQYINIQLSVCYIRLCHRCPIASPKSCLTSDNSYWGHWHYYQFKPHRQMQKSTFLEKAIHEIDMYNKNILILLGSGDAYLYNKYLHTTLFGSFWLTVPLLKVFWSLPRPPNQADFYGGRNAEVTRR